MVANMIIIVRQHTSSPSLILSLLFIDSGAEGERVVCRNFLSLILIFTYPQHDKSLHFNKFSRTRHPYLHMNESYTNTDVET